MDGALLRPPTLFRLLPLMHNFLEMELRLAKQKLLAYQTESERKYRPEYIQQLLHVIEYLTGRLDDFKREHAL